MKCLNLHVVGAAMSHLYLRYLSPHIMGAAMYDVLCCCSEEFLIAMVPRGTKGFCWYSSTSWGWMSKTGTGKGELMIVMFLQRYSMKRRCLSSRNYVVSNWKKKTQPISVTRECKSHLLMLLISEVSLHSVILKETYETLAFIWNKINYDEHKCLICTHLKVVVLLNAANWLYNIHMFPLQIR